MFLSSIRRERVRFEDEFRLDLSRAQFALLRFGRSAIIGRTCRRSIGGRSLFVSVSQPWSWRRALAGSNFKEDLLNLLSNFSAPARTDRNAIDGANGGNLCGRAAEEKFVSHVQRRALNRPLLNSNSEFAANLDHAVAGNTRQYRR